MNEKMSLDSLNQNSVSVRKQNYAEIEGQEYPIGESWRRAYVNSVRGRSDIEIEIPEPYKSAIFAVWGDTPTVIESE